MTFQPGREAARALRSIHESTAHPFVALRRARILPRWMRRLDARTARAINRRRVPAYVDRRFVRISRLADRSRLWLVISFLLYAMGGRARRGAVRGAASLVVGSVLANLVGKKIFGGDRPLLKDVPVPRRLKRFPTSASFPSGHAASAAAFVTGVALESGRTGLQLAPLGTAVTYSRLHTGAHWLSDVIGGVVLGSAVAVAGRMLIPARPTPPPVRSAPAVGLPALPGGEGAFILVNGSSGIDPRRPDPVEFLSDALPDARIHVLRDGDDIPGLVREAAGSQAPPRVLGVWGGDGSVAAAADAARSVGLPLLVLPGGTFNHFARTAGIPTIDDALEALRTGAGRRVDVAELALDAGESFTVLNGASVGVYAGFVSEREPREKGLGKPLAALVAAARVLARAEAMPVSVDGHPARVWSVAVAVGQNSSASMVPLQRRHLDDGLLDVRVLHAVGRMPRLRGLVALAFGARASSLLDRVPGRGGLRTIEAFTARTVRIEVRTEPGQTIGIAHDGEVTETGLRGGGAVATVTIAAGGLDVYSVAAPDDAR
ncbi:diacylglycerol kinase family enzyme/membrane-associated phospholipid phosphatase [Microbacterium sp. W4I4]|uniref:bifunctional phosphatase PAP2/diacylglycerol kinase family protein n=1 Tax=Microbacterium sp. W4I4 TaxID=3042295 RepID=UPI0027848F9B|nr:bifunctional phosphatase PAP2/diacylglycerol kinase family protein [Microbacterium sp. W4I4]MDQ0612872.1 diacylglycerol kinase family enzyme/membrane-associated phospholipid phosphatase [Microbacterium sp. W4I4]